MVSADRVEPSKINSAEKVPVLCVHGDTEAYPTAEIELCLGGSRRKAKLAVAPSLPVPVLLGRYLYDVWDGWRSPEAALVAKTRAHREAVKETQSDMAEERIRARRANSR